MAADLARVRVIWTAGSGAPYISTFMFGFGGIGDGTEQQDATAVIGWIANVKGTVFTGYTLTVPNEVELIDKSTGEVVGVTSVTGGGSAGTNGGTPLPPATQTVTKLRTGTFYGGRELKGRSFLGGQVTANMSGGLPTAGLITTVDAAYNALKNDANTSYSVWSRKKHVANNVITVATWSEFAVLRSRRD